jgi:uncharacterized protein
MTFKPTSPWPAIHAGLFLAMLAAVAVFLPALAWPWYALLPLAFYAGMAFLVPPLRQSFPKVSAGRCDWLGLLSGAAISVTTTVVLIAYQAAASPDLTTLATKIPIGTFGNIAVAWLCFSLGNALLEELIFRGILYQAVAAEWGVAIAIGATAIFFGLGHFDGYPPGWTGAALACIYGIALGLLRWWSGGLGLVVACHVCADATIFGIVTFGN